MVEIYIDSQSRILTENRKGQCYQTSCALGKNGVVAAEAKREGDNKTPLGCWPIRGALLRPDRFNTAAHPPFNVQDIKIPWRWIRPNDGWCDDSQYPCYNRPVTLPFSGSAESLWRQDSLYDIIITLGYNDRPAFPYLGSAIFLHCRIFGRQTAGCVAVMPDFLENLLIRLQLGDSLKIF
ncbi:MAG: L,D-transpeptidase family protein [Zymomonas mobilis]|uniref:L,D-transpeptidase-like protein n=1 Tax=Zymomonas mobilis TaxID=542 RepID=A0A542W331_ZYMMB|nr:L,D-transpeptidase family protein [Zymomonas mobilis]TQL17996.1 L,D-transpeptidase-like protein [Zymomonas mobilis]